MQIFQIVFEIPFNSKRKYHLVIARMVNDMLVSGAGENVTYKLMIKGAAEIIIKHCSTISVSDEHEPVPLTDERMAEFQVHILGVSSESKPEQLETNDF